MNTFPYWSFLGLWWISEYLTIDLNPQKMKVSFTSFFVWAAQYKDPNLSRFLSFISTMILCVFSTSGDILSFFLSFLETVLLKRNLYAKLYSNTLTFQEENKLKTSVDSWGVGYVVPRCATAGSFRRWLWSHLMGWSVGSMCGTFLGWLRTSDFLVYSTVLMLF